MSQANRFEFAGDHLFAHTVEQRQGRVLSIVAQNLGKCRRERGFRYDFSFDAGGKSLRPSLVMTFDGGQALFFTDQCVEIANTLFNCHFVPPFQVRIRRFRTNLIYSLNVPLRVLAHETTPVRPALSEKLTGA